MTPNPFSAANLATYLPYLPLAVGCGVGLVVLTIFSLRARRGGAAEAGFAPPLGGRRGHDPDAAEDSLGNRRGTVRREGAPVKVLVSSPTLRNKVDSGYVLDRSTGGLRIALSVPMTAGGTMQVRAAHAPDTIPWVTVLVRNCRNAGQHYELGCEFDHTPPWNVLLLFG